MIMPTMLNGCQHRGPDSTGFVLYADAGDLRHMVTIDLASTSVREANELTLVMSLV